MRYGAFLAGNLKNLVLSVHGTKQLGSAAGPATISGPAARAETQNDIPAATIAPRLTKRYRYAGVFIGIPPCVGQNTVLCANLLEIEGAAARCSAIYICIPSMYLTYI